VLQTENTKTVTLIVSTIGDAYVPDYGVIMISAVFATLPTVLIFFLLQRRFVEGLLGSVK
jgi:lactose/L-arabinose transport system permease protein